MLRSLALSVWLIGCVVTGASAADDRPNIVVLLCDDLGYGDLECYGHPHIQTPHLNRLAQGGIRFTDCYSAAPVCSPSRVGLLTGRSPNRAGVYDWIPPAKNQTADRRNLVHMRAGEVTIPALLRKAGYQTAMAGKWHCNSAFNDDRQPQPGDFGFDHWLATQNNALPSHKHPKNFVRNGNPVGATDDFSCQVVASEAIDWLAKTDDDKPFFLYVPFHEPHEPVASPEAIVAKYRDVANSEDQAQYFANVHNVDLAVGRIIDALDQSGRRDNTLVIFTSDNGPETLNRYASANRSYGTPGHLRGMKLHTTEAGFRVVGIMNWPAAIQAGQTVSVPVSSLDFLPTFCRLGHAETPAAATLDGTDFGPALTGHPIDRSKPLVWVYFNAINEHRVAMRDGKWKVIAKLDGGSFPKMQNVTRSDLDRIRSAKLTDIEVYDLEMDTSEQTDLAQSDPAMAAEWAAKLTTAYQELVNHSHVW
ncbi:Arylsulfatase [Rubripirellula lacrimiformis]|uniref:Arylsulfatase n=1 Tax=Rubripirellula lacrimiformis TaxID=1930273 RepID=A0A517NIH3_9BACT|nr:sulfatase-like hydrolase/transferase [Rubripirellula lacrimiformis]QDT06853.1 Arylsulfatase [Rubripirellula lacrimiformis]